MGSSSVRHQGITHLCDVGYRHGREEYDHHCIDKQKLSLLDKDA